MKSYARWIIIAGIFAIPFLPYIVVNDFFFPYITGKNFAFRIFVELMFGAWIFLAISDQKYRPRWSWIALAVTAFTISLGLSNFFGVDPHKSFWSNYERMEGYITLIHLMAYFIASISVLTAEKLWRNLFYTTLGVSALVNLSEVSELIRLLTQGATTIRLDSTFGNPIYLAVYNLFHIFLAAYCMSAFAKSKIAKGLLAALMVINGVALYFTATRGTILGLIGGVGLAALLVAIFERENKKLRMVAAGTVLAGVLLIVGFVGIRNTDFVQTSPVLSRFANISLEDNTTKARFMIWNMAWQGVQERPVLGWGQGNFPWIFSKYYDPGMYAQEPWFDRAHNVFFDWLTAGGVLGLLFYLSIFLATLYHLWFNRENGFTMVERSVLTGLLAGYFVHNVFVFDNLISWILFFTLIAYVHSRSTEPVSLGSLREKLSLEPVWESLRSGGPAFAGVIAAATIGAVYYLNVPAMNVNKALINGMRQQPTIEENLKYFEEAIDGGTFGAGEVRERIVFQAMQVFDIQNISPDTRTRFDALATQAIKDQMEAIPGDSKYPLFLSSYLMRAGRLEEALTYADKALELSPKKQAILYQKGNILLNMGATKKAYEVFTEAYELATKNREAARFYAIAAVYAGEDAVAEEVMLKHFGTTTLAEIPLAQAYATRGQNDRALVIWKALYAASPNNAQYAFTVAATYIQLDQKEKALEVLAGVRERRPELSEQIDAYIAEIQGK